MTAASPQTRPAQSVPAAPAPALLRLLAEGRQLAVEDLLGQLQRLRPHRIDGASELRVGRRLPGPVGLRRTAVRIDHQVTPTAPPAGAIIGSRRPPGNDTDSRTRSSERTAFMSLTSSPAATSCSSLSA